MGTPSPRISVGRLAVVGLIVFAANAALLVLQLVAGRLLSPFIGSSLETWTSVIGVFLAGIALGNGFGGRIADRYPSSRTLAILLGIGAISALWMVAFPMILQESKLHTSIELGLRIPVLAFVLCFPAGLTLSLLTPLAIKLGLPDVRKAGRVAGVVFALGTLGCLVGNYATGFYLIPSYTLNTIVYGCAAVLAVLALVSVPLGVSPPTFRSEDSASRLSDGAAPAALSIRRAYLIVFCASFGAMTLELTGVRLLARTQGVSLFTWTGIIGVMLAGTAAGNIVGGQLADRHGRSQDPEKRLHPLAFTLVSAAGVTVCIFFLNMLVVNWLFGSAGVVVKVVGVSFLLFFAPMFAFGMVSPQVIRLVIPDVGHAGRVAGQIYGWSTTGAIAGTFATGYLLISTLGTEWTIAAVAILMVLLSLSLTRLWKTDAGLYLLAISLGAIVGKGILDVRNWLKNDPTQPNAILAMDDSNYYFILVARDEDHPERLKLNLDHLLHSVVDPTQPTYLYYQHEGVQMEMLWDAKNRAKEPRMLVIGGGGFTFPRCAKTLLPEAQVEVVEIDPAVTRAAEKHLGFDRAGLGIPVHHMDGRQFVAEKVKPGTYDIVVLDAVNDYSVPAHLTTKEFNDAVKKGLAPDGVYLLTVIDDIADGRLWKACYRTLKESFAHVELIAPHELTWDKPDTRTVFVIYASDRPLDLARLGKDAASRFASDPDSLRPIDPAATIFTRPAEEQRLQEALDREPVLILTDQFAPVDNLMADIFRKRAAAKTEK